VEGYTERYGMEYRRAYHDESPDPWLESRHERQISPLLHRRALFAEVRNFLLYDFYNDSGSVNENVFAYSNGQGGHRALVIYNNKFADTHGWIRISSSYAEKFSGGGRALRQRDLANALDISGDSAQFVAARDTVTGLEHIYSGRELREKGMRFDLGAYQCHVFLDWKHLRDDFHHPWRELYDHLRGQGVASLADAMRDLQLKPVHEALYSILDPPLIEQLFDVTRMDREQAGMQSGANLEGSALSTNRVPAEISARVAAIGEETSLTA